MESQDNLTFPPLCASGCGFYGSVENHNLCSKCYKDFLKRKEEALAAKISAPLVVSSPSNNAPFLFDIPLPSSNENGSCSLVNKEDSVLATSSDDSSGVDLEKKKRCQSCNKRVRLLGFECRCGFIFCGDHRYPEKHSCTFDYKKMEREALAVKNPLIRADKLDDRL